LLPPPALSGSGFSGRGLVHPPLSLAIQAPRISKKYYRFNLSYVNTDING